MLGYKLNHREFGFRVRGQTDSDRILIKRVATAALFARLGERVVPLVQTPQCQLLAGEPRACLSHLNGEGKAGAAKAISALDTLLGGNAGYLAGEYQDDYILCETRGDTCVMLDGVHRAAVLLHAKVESIPMAIQRSESQRLPGQPRARAKQCRLHHREEPARPARQDGLRRGPQRGTARVQPDQVGREVGGWLRMIREHRPADQHPAADAERGPAGVFREEPAPVAGPQALRRTAVP